MSVESNKAVLRAFIAAINARDWSRVETLVAPDVMRHSSAPDKLRGHGREGLVRFLQAEAEAFPDSEETIQFLVGEGNKVAARLGFRGTQHGVTGAFPPSGKVLSAEFLGIFQIDDGKIAQVWVEFDNLHALIELGHYRLPSEPVT